VLVHKKLTLNFPHSILSPKHIPMKIVLAALCLFCTLQTFGQEKSVVSIDSLQARYNHETLHFFKGFISKGENGERIRFANLRNEFTGFSEALKEYDLFKKKRTTAAIISGLGIGVVVVGLIVHNNTNNNLTPSLIIGFGEGILIGSIPINFSSSKKLQHAIWLRNRDVVFGGK
jgi:uncharacterized membrane protein